MKPTIIAPERYNVLEAATYLGICERSMRELLASGQITYRRTGGPKKGRIIFFREDLDPHLQPVGGPGARANRKSKTG